MPRRELVAALAVTLLPLFLFSPANAQVIVFQDDFDHDTLDERPELSPPGEPTGDRIFINSNGGQIEVRDEVGDLTDKPLELRSSEGSGHFRFEAIGDPKFRDCETYTLEWDGLIHAGVFYFYAAVRDTNRLLMAGVEYRQFSVFSFNGSGNQLSTPWFRNISQRISITLDIPNGTTSLSIDGVPQPEAQNVPFYQHGADSFESINFSGTGAYVYAIDNMMFTATGCPSVGTEERSWGSLKAGY